MDIQQLLSEYNPWWEARFTRAQVVERKEVLARLTPLMSTPEIVMLTGLRRVGKTITMKCLLYYLIDTLQVDARYCLYVSMDDYQLSKLSLLDVITEYRKLQKISVREKIYVFFDEITYIDNFQIQLKNCYDSGNVKCVVSSSSSSVLKDDSAMLTGRKRIIEINPLDFDEFLLFKNIQLSAADANLREVYFLEYMQVGGMPEYVLHGDREYLVGLIDDILMKDIVAHYGIRNPNLIRDFFMLLMERAGKQVSLNKLAKILQISPDTAKRYLAMFEQTYLIQLVPRFGKTNETLLSSKKIYATDIGMRNVAVGFRDKGAIFENIVFMKIKNNQPRYVLHEGQEIDFYFDDTLLEAKFLRELEGKQLAAFNDFKASNKVLIQQYDDLVKFVSSRSIPFSSMRDR